MKRSSGKCFFILLLSLSGILLTGCASSVGVSENSVRDRYLYNAAELTAGMLDPDTANLLNNYQLMELYEDSPGELIARLERIYAGNREKEIIAALADASLRIGCRMRGVPEKSYPYFLASAVYSGVYLKYIRDKNQGYDDRLINLIRIHNSAVTELFCYLKKCRKERSSGFELKMPGGRTVRFSVPDYELPFPEQNIGDFTPCANFRAENLTHISRTFGIGVPMIAKLSDDYRDPVGFLIPGLPVAVTLVMDFQYDFQTHQVSGKLKYIYTRTRDTVLLGEKTLPLASDFSTPLAKASDISAPIHFLQRMLKVKEAEAFTGLYLFEPYDDQRIPVVFVHGLMSDMKTWVQMLNTLLHDQEIRKKYQFLGFSYSSGNPIFVSGARLRQELRNLRNNLIAEHRSTEAFDQMVLVGHSMGGLLSRLQISSCTPERAAELLEVKNPDVLKQKISGEEFEQIRAVADFQPGSFIKRVIFISVPHRGSEIARSWIGTFGAACIDLPVELIRRNVKIIGELVKNGSVTLESVGKNTGIENLRPDSPMLNLLNQLPMDPEIPYHSIIGNNKAAFTPGGTDGVVPYWSSHLDHSRSEFIVKSGHSSHRTPLAIQEVRQILRLHAGFVQRSLNDFIR